jgi:hypothetical protein
VSLIDAPMALLDRILARRSHAVHPDDPIARMVARTTGRLRPEGDYQRRLRGQFVNQFVAMREGIVSVPAARQQMGRLGRAVLYATFGLAASVSAVGAASSGSLPGDPLYAVKRDVEELRIQIAPASVRASLVAMALDERLLEVERLAAAQRWTLVPAASADADAAERRLVAMTGGLSADEVASLTHHHDVLTALLATAPATAQSGLLNAIAVSSASHGVVGDHAQGSGQATGGTGQGSDEQGQTGGQSTGGAAQATPEATPEPSRSPHPEPTPKASPTEPPPSPHPTRSPTAPAGDNEP